MTDHLPAEAHHEPDDWRSIGESAVALVEVIQRHRLRYRAGEEAADSGMGKKTNAAREAASVGK